MTSNQSSRTSVQRLLRTVWDTITEYHSRHERLTIDELFDLLPELEPHVGLIPQIMDLLDAAAALEPDAAAPAALESAEGGSSFGDFELVRPLGQGGMGRVYLAYQKSTGRPVALKTAPPASVLEPAQKERFLREVQAAASLCHPAIAHVYTGGERNGVLYYAMEYVQGQTLGELLAEARALQAVETAEPQPAKDSFVRLLGYLIDACRAVHHAHEAGIIHRDIKPQNLMVTDRGALKLIDFGLAKITAAETGGATGGVLGTPAYMSPEQIRGQPVDPRTDIYSLGVVLYEIATGRLPWQETSHDALYHAIVAEVPPRPRRLNPSLSRDLEAIILMAMEKRPELRYPTALALADDLTRFLNYEPVRARTIGLWTHALRTARRRPRRAGAGLLLAAGLLAGLLVWYFQPAWFEAVGADGWTVRVFPDEPALRTSGQGPDGSEEEGRAARRPLAEHALSDESPVTVRGLAPGRYVLVVSGPGYQPERREVLLARGKNPTQVFALPRDMGPLTVDSSPYGAALSLEKMKTDATFEPTGQNLVSPAHLTLDSGTYRLTMTKSGYETRVTTVEIKRNQATTVRPNLTPLRRVWNARLADPVLSLVAADLDGDGAVEIIAGAGDCLRILEVTDNPDKKPAPADERGLFSARPTVTRLPHRPDPVIIAPCWDNNVWCLDTTGAALWHTNTGGLNHSPALVLDADRDTHPEVYVGTHAGRLLCLEAATGAIRWSASVPHRVETSPVALDPAGAGTSPILVAAAGGFLYALDHAGTVLWCRALVEETRSGEPTGHLSLRPTDPPAELADYDKDAPGPGLSLAADPQTGAVWITTTSGTVACLTMPGPALRCQRSGLGGFFSPPLLADLTGDGRNEVVLVSRTRRLYALDQDAQILWQRETPSTVDSTACPVDLNGDGALELVMSGTNGTVYSCDATGALAWTWDFATPCECQPLAVDLDNDELPEVLVGFTNGQIVALGRMPAAVKSVYTADDWIAPSYSLIPGAGATHDLVVASRDGSVVRLAAADGDRIWTWRCLAGWVSLSPWSGDLDNDGARELVVASHDATVLCLRADDGTEKWQFKTGGKVRWHPVVADLDGDGALEIIVGSRDRFIYCLKASTGDVAWKMETAFEIDQAPLVADLDHDGTQEILLRFEPASGDILCLRHDKTTWWQAAAHAIVLSLVEDYPAPGQRSLLYMGNDNALVCLLPDGSEAWRWSQKLRLNPQLLAATLARGQTPRLFALDTQGRLLCFDLETGAPLWQTAFKNAFGAPPILADIDSTGKKTLLCIDPAGLLAAFDPQTGAHLWQVPLRFEPTVYSFAACDLTGDSRTEVLVGTSDGHLLILDPEKLGTRRNVSD